MIRRLLCKIRIHNGEELVRIGHKAVWRCPTCEHTYFMSDLAKDWSVRG